MSIISAMQEHRQPTLGKNMRPYLEKKLKQKGLGSVLIADTNQRDHPPSNEVPIGPVYATPPFQMMVCLLYPVWMDQGQQDKSEIG
jgi:hypothetical protein